MKRYTELIEPAVAELSAVETVTPSERSHQIEQTVRRQLLGHPDLHISSLVIRRVANGVCLEGVLEAGDNSPDVCQLVQAVTGIEQVFNHLVVRRSAVKG